MDNQELKKQQKYWDQVLKDSGFEDIEQRDGNLKTWSIRFCNEVINSETKMVSKIEYYRLAGHFLFDYKFKDDAERRIWALHTEGVSVRHIVKTLEEEKLWFPKIHPDALTLDGTKRKTLAGNRNMKPNRRAVHETIQRLVKHMIRYARKEYISD